MMGDAVAFNTKYHRAQLKHLHRVRWILQAAPDPLITAMARARGAVASEPIVGPLDRLAAVRFQ